MEIALRASELFWIGGLAAIPVALAVGGLCRVLKCRPATRHALWCAVLFSFITPVIAGMAGRPGWFSSGRVLAAADSISARVAAQDGGRAEAPAMPPGRRANMAAAPRASRERDAGAGRVVNYMMSRALPALLARSLTPIAEDNWPARIASVRRDYSNTVSLLSEQPGPADDRARAPVVQTHESPRAVGRTAARERTPAAPGPERSSRPIVTIRAEPTAPPIRDAAWTPGEEARPVVAAAPARPLSGDSGPAGRAAWTSRARDWLAAVLAVRDALAGVPPIPAPVWAGGALLIAAVWAVRLVRARRLLSRGRAAPAEVRLMVEEASRRLGLARTPGVLVIDERVSPMIWCGLRPRLVLPAGLWDDLDGDSRLSVVLHELAHLRRRDHRLCWLESLVGLVYWWHPAAWWARRRIRDEADLACDAWVLSVVPGHRRAYAEALVTTRSFLSMPGCRVTPGLGVMTKRTKKLSRRLTMVMTQRVAPRPSLIGASLAVAVAMTGMFVTPGLACPPDEEGGAPKAAVAGGSGRAAAKEKAAKERAAKKSAAGREAPARARAAAPSAPRDEAGQEFFGERPALEAMRARGQGGSAAEEPEAAQIQRLEEQLRVLERRLEQLNRRAGSGRGAQSRVLPAPLAPTSPVAPGSPVAPVSPAMPAPAPHALVSPFGQSAPSPLTLSLRAEGQVAQSYSLPEGKLEALTGLMSRDDVPVLIEPHPDHIVVHATPRQHEVFSAFVRLIHPETGQSLGTTLNLAVPSVRLTDEARRHAELAAKAGQLEALRGHMKGLEGQRSSLETRAREMEERAEEARRRADEIRERADQLRREQDDRRSEGGDSNNADPLGARALLAAANRLEAQARTAETAADQMERRADGLEAQAEELAEAAEAIERAMEDLGDQLEEASLAIFSGDELSDCEGCEEEECEDADDAAAQSRITDRPAEETEVSEAIEPATAGGR